MSSMRRSVLLPDETLRREMKIRRAVEYFWRTVISSIRHSVSSSDETPRSSSKILGCAFLSLVFPSVDETLRLLLDILHECRKLDGHFCKYFLFSKVISDPETTMNLISELQCRPFTRTGAYNLANPSHYAPIDVLAFVFSSIILSEMKT